MIHTNLITDTIVLSPRLQELYIKIQRACTPIPLHPGSPLHVAVTRWYDDHIRHRPLKPKLGTHTSDMELNQSTDSLPDDDNYISSEDEDFNPDAVTAADANESSSTDSEPEPTTPTTASKRGPNPKKGVKKKKRWAQDGEEETEDAGFENSGDEGIIRKGTKRKRKGSMEDEDGGGEGGFVKTRSMRAVG